MKFINLILENVEIPFEAKCKLTIVNSEGNNRRRKNDRINV
jgi:hypothetical protein